MSSITNYERNVTQDARDMLARIVQGVAPEFVLEMLADLYEPRPGIYNHIAAAWCMAACAHICEELPGHPRQKDFPDEDKTIGEMVVYLMNKHPDSKLQECVDYVINRKTVMNMVEQMQKK